MWLLRNSRIYDGWTYSDLLECYRVAVQSYLLMDSKNTLTRTIRLAKSELESYVNKCKILDISILSRIKPFKCENRFLGEKLCIDEPIFGVATF